MHSNPEYQSTEKKTQANIKVKRVTIMAKLHEKKAAFPEINMDNVLTHTLVPGLDRKTNSILLGGHVCSMQMKLISYITCVSCLCKNIPTLLGISIAVPVAILKVGNALRFEIHLYKLLTTRLTNSLGSHIRMLMMSYECTCTTIRTQNSKPE